MKVLLDTSILIDYLRGVAGAKTVIDRVKNREIDCCVSVLTEAELFAGKECEKESKRKEILALIFLFTKFSLDNEISQKAGEFKRKYDSLLDDCIIAATAFSQKCRIWTKDIRDFKRIEEVEIEEPY